MSNAKLERTIARFEAKIDSGAFYEAHQTLRTITNRYVKSKQYKDAIDLLYQGSKTLATNKEYASASDLISYLIEVYNEADVSSVGAENKDYKMKVIELVNLLPNNDPSLADLSKQSIAWSQKGNVSKFGDSDLHHCFGVKFVNGLRESSNATEDELQKSFSLAEFHLIFGTAESLPYYVNFLYDWSQSSKNLDPGAFLGRAVINYAYLKDIHSVKESGAIFIKNLVKHVAPDEENQKEEKTFYYYDKFTLVNFFQLLSLTLTKEHSGQKFLKLYDHYKPVLAEFEFKSPVEYLGRIYFGLQLGNPQGGQNMLANLMGGLFK